MVLIEQVPLASLTTFKVGGAAWYVAMCESEEDLKAAVTYARDCGLPWYVIGGGSNILASDEGYEGVIIRPLITGIAFEETKVDRVITVVVGAGVVWDTLVQETVSRGLWGLENLASIPGFVGGAPVQNIGAYGADVSDTLLYADAFDTVTGKVIRLTKEGCDFGYRESRFKHDPSLIILRAAFGLSLHGTPRTSYPDLVAYQQAGSLLDTPESIAKAVREIRAKKFPDLRTAGTAGSFFKNPIITREAYETLRARYPGLPMYSIVDASGQATSLIKVPLAWILDHVLHIRGYAKGRARLFEHQPLVLVSEVGATANDIQALAQEVERMVKEKTKISIEREVRMLS